MFYEVHVTVDSTDVERWEKLCANLGIKPLLIELARGTHRRQLMCAALHRGDDASAHTYVEQLEEAIEDSGLEILRTKLERPLSDTTDGDEVAYLETHIKLMLRPFEEPLLLMLSDRDLHVSRSTLGGPVVGRTKWYLTQRTYGIPPRQTERIFASTLRAVETRLPVTKMEMEAVMFDTNPALDAGWAAA